MPVNGNGRLEPLHTYGDWRGEAWVAAPLEHDGKRYGLLLLGPRRATNRTPAQEFAALQGAANEVAHALAVEKDGSGSRLR